MTDELATSEYLTTRQLEQLTGIAITPKMEFVLTTDHLFMREDGRWRNVDYQPTEDEG